ncbi:MULTISPECIES: polysaccharide pyruvyl transferase family protein [Pseudoalteromonas]|uniref:polysaccharide pyruvyl transferase family protein n=1 Tax=Pseudoalteromonas TaxID=53246 RepID=UPI0015819D86|nr:MULTISPECIES: polysaccharide pyruvyl transferase family protein [Pseudoalteromonas]MDI4652073.1 polysaccharide pyruvyl transferase family protein [Pseudoalteromonas shioyasakiensis]NUJ38398.1 polysaccharide pyruvyl transferase family protein [Pseudoalteromonas sp. 0303]
MMIEIKGVQFENKGAELMLQAILFKLKNEFPNFELCLEHNVNSPYSERVKVDAYQKISLKKNVLDLNFVFYLFPKKFRLYLKNRFGIVSEADVDVLLDASGFSYGDQWSDTILKQTSSEVKRFKKKGKKYIFMPQSLGPFTRAANKKHAKIAFENATLVFARELPSYNNVVKLVRDQQHVYKSPDFTNLIEPVSSIKLKEYENSIVLIPNSKMLSSKNKQTWWHKNYEKTFKTIAELAYSKGENVILLNHSGKEDKALCERLKSNFSFAIEVIEPSNALEVKAIISLAKMVVSSRFHGCVSALSQGVPCIATGWSHKYQELFKDYRCESMLLKENHDQESLQKLFLEVFKCRDKYHSTLIEISKSYKYETEQTWQRIFKGII